MAYRPPSKEFWKGRVDGPHANRIHEAVQLIDMQNISQEPFPGTLAFGFIGFACDEGVKRNQGNTGASHGPEAIRKALAKLPLPHTSAHYFDFGDITCENNDLEAAQAELAAAVTFLHGKGIKPLVLGGGHEVAWGHYQGIAATHQDKDISIINFDAHFDLRPLLDGDKGTSGTSFLQMAKQAERRGKPFHYTCFGIQETGNTLNLFDAAAQLKVKYVTADVFHLGETEPALELLDDVLSQADIVYATICLDVFAAPFAPGVSAPQPLGLLPWHVIPLLERLAASGKVAGLDIAELCPARDREGVTAQLAASLLFQFMSKSV